MDCPVHDYEGIKYLAETFFSFAPGTGTVIDIWEAVSGRDMWGAELPPSEQAFSLLEVLLPFALGKVSKMLGATASEAELIDELSGYGLEVSGMVEIERIVENAEETLGPMESNLKEWKRKLEAGKLSGKDAAKLTELILHLDVQVRAATAQSVP